MQPVRLFWNPLKTLEFAQLLGSNIICLSVNNAVNNRLRKHLTGAKLDCGETPQSFRLGLSNTLNMLGCSQDDLSRYLGWRRKDMARHYTRMSNTAGSFPIPALRSLCQTPVSHPSNLQCIV